MNCFWWWQHKWSKWETAGNLRTRSEYSGEMKVVGEVQERRCEKCGKKQYENHWFV